MGTWERALCRTCFLSPWSSGVRLETIGNVHCYLFATIAKLLMPCSTDGSSLRPRSDYFEEEAATRLKTHWPFPVPTPGQLQLPSTVP